VSDEFRDRLTQAAQMHVDPPQAFPPTRGALWEQWSGDNDVARGFMLGVEWLADLLASEPWVRKEWAVAIRQVYDDTAEEGLTYEQEAEALQATLRRDE
jgi:hypothetical protein